MKGDFSKLSLVGRNYTGVLHQEGRVHLDQDENAEHFITSGIRRQMARDVIGAGVAAVPAGESAGFQVTEAEATAAGVEITLAPGRLWLEGQHIELGGSGTVTLPAEYFGPPVQTPQESTNSIAAGVRDAVVLEAWEETLNAFQDPINLLEPALGGVDTTERAHLFFRLRLFRLENGEDCHSIADRLATDPDALGHLTVTASPIVIVGGDCPVDTGGGYTGLEHYLYRIEIDTPDAGGARFKWSRFNGGLVGRGRINLAGDSVTIDANAQMINHCGLTSFYLEALTQPGPDQPWLAACTAQASLASDGILSLTQLSAPWPAPVNVSVFFRLWDGVHPIADFTSATDLENGIRLDFDPPVPASGETNYRLGDYWTFPARAAGSNFDPAVWPSDAPPDGIVYYRAPLAEITWPAPVPVVASVPADIEDCRRSFPPLTRLRVCCTFTVGDGVTSFGDFNSIEDALAALPANGGEICLMPGLHTANARIENRRDIRIHGCGIHSHVVPRQGSIESPIFHIIDSVNIQIDNLDAFAPQGNAIVAEGSAPAGVSEIEITQARIVAGISTIVVANGAGIGIRHNLLRVIDRSGGLEAILVMAEGAWIERNDIGVVPAEQNPPPGAEQPPDRPRPEDPCEPPGGILTIPRFITAYLDFAFTAELLEPPQNTYIALGGIRVAGGSERITILENTINGGFGDGINLGGSVALEEAVEPEPPPDVEVTVTAGGLIHGLATTNATPADDIIFSLRRSDGIGREYFATSETDGVFQVLDRSITTGAYTMRVETPGYVIANVSMGSGGVLVPGSTILVALRPRDVEQRVFGGAAIEETLIQRNEILHMGLSGIGTSGIAYGATLQRPPLSSNPTIIGQFSTVLFGLEIDGNQIQRCARNPFDDALLALAAMRGLGGISLGLCDEVVISANRLERNGLSHVDPITGVFAALVDHIEIHGNTIANNGPLLPTALLQPVRLGFRGGIVIRALAAVEHIDLGDEDLNTPAIDQVAARVFDNVVRQPVGQALTILASGPVTVDNNFLSSNRRGPMIYDLLAGVVLILNMAGREVYSVAGGAVAPPAFVATPRLSPDGKVLYTNNQVRFGILGDSFFGQVIWTRGDLGYDSNQADYLGRGLPIGDNGSYFVNTGLLADTVRASDSRFKEGALATATGAISLVATGTIFNITAGNQGDHCIFAFSPGAVVNTPNQVIDSTLCPQLGPGLNNSLSASGTLRTP